MNHLLLYHLSGIIGLLMAILCWQIYFSKVIRRKKRLYIFLFLGDYVLALTLFLFGFEPRVVGICALISLIAFLAVVFFLYSNWEVEPKPSRGFRHLSGF